MNRTGLSRSVRDSAKFPSDFKGPTVGAKLVIVALQNVTSIGGYMFSRLVLSFTGFLIFVAAPKALAQGNDVYNFYFQKGSAPQTVNQGGGGQAVTAPPVVPLAPAPAPVAPSQVVTEPTAPLATAVVATAKPEPQPARDYNRFELFLGPTRISDEVGTGTAYTVGAQVNFNRYVGMRLQGHRLATETAEYTVGTGYGNFAVLKDRDSSSNLYGGQAALVFTPIHLDLLGHKLVRVSGLAGLMSQRRWNFNGFSAEDSVRTEVRPFLGVSAGVALNDNVGVEASVAMLDGGKVGQATGSLVFSF